MNGADGPSPSGHGKSIRGARSRNEDRILVDNDHALYAVADGVGGLAHGDRASSTAVNALTRFIAAAHATDLSSALTDAHRRIRQFGKLGAPAGTTLTTLHQLRPHHWELFHIGDSAAFVITPTQIFPLTRPHHAAPPRIRIQQATPVQPPPKVLNHYLGMAGSLKFQWSHLHTDPGERLLLATDGVTEQLDLSTLHTLAMAQTSAVNYVNALLEVAQIRGSQDNLSAVVIDLPIHSNY